MANQNLQAVHRFWKGFDAHNLDVWDEVCTFDFINHDPGLPVPDADLATLKQVIGGLLAAFPDLTSTEHDLIDSGDKIVVRRTLSGTHQGAFAGIPATGNKVAFEGVWIAKMQGGKIREQWVVPDILGLMRQAGAIPAPPH